MNELEQTNYDDSEFIFSWDQPNPLLRPNPYKCKICDTFLNPDGSRCRDTGCSNCGHKLKTQRRMNPIHDYKSNPGAIINLDENVDPGNVYTDPDDMIEHMIESNDRGGGMIIVSTVSYLIIMVLAYIIAHSRNEIQLLTCCCIFFFPYLYLAYVVYDSLIVGNKWKKE